jgi:hypothetical protein
MSAALAMADLPVGSANLYSASLGDAWVGIGTPDELRSYVEQGTMPSADELRFRLEWEASL